MRILHYSLGFPTYRTGGMPQYCVDLMQEQKRHGDEVGMLWPGSMGLWKGKPGIRHKQWRPGMESYELIHPLPVALDEGIGRAQQFMEACNSEAYVSFLNKVKPDIIHFHTFMGIHKEFLEAAKRLYIPMIYTTHDFYGLCPKVTFYCHGDVCTDDNRCRECVGCNAATLSISKIRLLQSPPYRMLKDTFLVKKFRGSHRAAFFGEPAEQTEIYSETSVEEKRGKYQKLRNYYISMFKMMDMMHYNSRVTESVYRKYLDSVPGKVISISNRNISNNKQLKSIPKKIRFAFLSAPSPVKGYKMLKQALDCLWEEGYRNFELHSYGNGAKSEKYLITHPRYSHENLKNVMDHTDMVLAPSCWYETFGFVVSEALSYGVPVLLSDRVGAKDILEEGKSGIIVKADMESLKDGIRQILDSPAEYLGEMNEYIVHKQQIKTLDIHVKEMYRLYESLIICKH